MSSTQRMALISLGSFILLFFVINHLLTPNNRPLYHVGILVSAQHPALDLALEGIKKKLFIKLNQRIKFIEFVGNGSHEYLQNNAQALTLNEKLNLFIAIGSPACHALADREKQRPIVFAAVSDPQLHSLTQSNLCGISDKSETLNQFKFIKQLIPSAKKIGLLYTPDETYAQQNKQTIEALLHQDHYEIIEINLREKDSFQKAKSTDVLFAIEDYTIATAMKNIAHQALEIKKPLFTSYTPAVKEGAFASCGINYHKCGRKAGKFALKLLKDDTKAHELGIIHMPNNDISINEAVGSKLNIEIPAQLIKYTQKIDTE
jgi:putative tryptophan/tyrosine transport system substrate-binding protein